MREEEIPRNVARNVRTGTPRPRRFEPLTAKEARAFLTAASGHRLQPLFELALHTGLRQGELLGLRWEDLDLTGGTASIRRTLQRTNTADLTALPTKTQSSERRIALPTRCLRSLEQHRNHQRQERDAAGAGWKDSGYVFTRPNGAPIEGATLTRHFAHIGVTATVYAHVRLHLQRAAIDLLGHALRNPAEITGKPDGGDEPPLCVTLVRWRCRQLLPSDTPECRSRPHRIHIRWGRRTYFRKRRAARFTLSPAQFTCRSSSDWHTAPFDRLQNVGRHQ